MKRLLVTAALMLSALIGCVGASGSSPAVLRTAVVLVNFTNLTTQPWTVQQARTIAFDGPSSVAGYYLETSYGKQTLAGDVFGWITVPYPSSPCDTLAWKNAASAQLGFDLNAAYDHVAFVFPRTRACAYNARAGSFYNGDFTVQTMAHEVGHSFGLQHASRLDCVNAQGGHAMLSSSCSVSEYGDQFSVMGSSKKHFNGWEKARLGWLDNYLVVTGSGRYKIAPLAWQPQTSPQLLLVRRLDGSVFALEFRRPYGFDSWNATDWAVNGVLVRIAPGMPWEPEQVGTPMKTFLLDANPDWTAFNAPLAVGQSFTDPLGGFSVTVVSAGAPGAVVDVTLGG